jgi:CRISPR/Cas system-associated exonuclease Cas4 (RecB family)
MSDRIIRVSEIAEYVYCRRAWWLRRVGGFASTHMREMAAGARYHRRHGSTVHRANWGQRLALLFVFISIAIFVYALWQVM